MATTIQALRGCVCRRRLRVDLDRLDSSGLPFPLTRRGSPPHASLCTYTFPTDVRARSSDEGARPPPICTKVNSMASASPPELTLLGLDGAGKTTLWNRVLKKASPLETVPSNGLNFEEWSVRSGGGCCSEKVKIKLMDLAGNSRIRAYWARYYTTADALCFVVRATAEIRLTEAKNELFNVMAEPSLAHKPLLVLLNATGDGCGQAGPETVLSWLGISIGSVGRNSTVHPTNVEQVQYLSSNSALPNLRPLYRVDAPGDGISMALSAEPSAADALSAAQSPSSGLPDEWMQTEPQDEGMRRPAARPPLFRAATSSYTPLTPSIAVDAEVAEFPLSHAPPEQDVQPRNSPPRLVASHYEFVDENFCMVRVNGKTIGVSRCFLDRDKDRALSIALRWLVRGLTAYLEDYAEERSAALKVFATATPYSNLSRSEKIVRLESVRRRNDALDARDSTTNSQLSTQEADAADSTPKGGVTVSTPE